MIVLFVFVSCCLLIKSFFPTNENKAKNITLISIVSTQRRGKKKVCSLDLLVKVHSCFLLSSIVNRTLPIAFHSVKETT